MTSPQRFVVRMVLFILALAVMGIFLISPLERAFQANVFLNGIILGVLFLGIIYNLRQVLVLFPEVTWIELFRKNLPGLSLARNPRLLAPMATMLGDRRDTLSLSAQSMLSLRDGIASRLDESRDLSRYTIGLLIFLGLLGTFWGLLETVGSIRNVIGGLNVGGDDVTAVFSNLKRGLTAPLDGMGTAFSSSLFGLAGSLVLGFLDLQASQAQNRFYNDLEEWLSSLTRLSSGALTADGEASVPAYIQALLEQTAESLANLQRTLVRGEESNIASSTNLIKLTDGLSTLGDQMRAEQNILVSLAKNQTDLQLVLDQLAENNRNSSSSLDEVTQGNIKNIEVYVSRLLEELSSGRADLIKQVRSEIKLLARTIAASFKNTK